MVKGQMRMRRWQEQQSGGGYTLIVGAFPRSPLPPSTIIDPGEMQLRFRIRFGTLLDLFRSAQPPPPTVPLLADGVAVHWVNNQQTERCSERRGA